MWHEINNTTDIKYLIEIFGNFHDSCLKELQYNSGSYVLENLSMHPINDNRTVRMLFQRQRDAPSAIEIEFRKVVALHLIPCDEQYTSELVDISFFFFDGYLFWADSDMFEYSPMKFEGTWICAESARWRVADEHLGKRDVYANKHGC